MPKDVFLSLLIDDDADLFFLEEFIFFVEHGFDNLFFYFEYLNPCIASGDPKNALGYL